MGEPYLSENELINAPTGINWANIPQDGASDPEQIDARRQLIYQATAWADSIVQEGFMPSPGFSLSASLVTETIALTKSGGRRARFMPDGTFRFWTRYLPFVSLVGISYAPDAISWGALQNWNAIAEGNQTVRIVPPLAGAWGFTGYMGYPSYGWLQVQYIAGFPNSVLTSNLTHGSNVLVPLAEVAGIQPLTPLLIHDAPLQDERVTVASTWVPTTGAGNVPVVSVAYDHLAGLAVEAMPGTIRLATRMKVVEIVRERGVDTLTVGTAGRGRPLMNKGSRNPAGGNIGNSDRPAPLLQPFARTI